jgi:4-amino-4-deoxy-L-arabinose transferase-like glycosyltransferase
MSVKILSILVPYLLNLLNEISRVIWEAVLQSNKVFYFVSVFAGIMLVVIGQMLIFNSNTAMPGVLFFLLSFIPFLFVFLKDKNHELLGNIPFIPRNEKLNGKVELIFFLVFAAIAVIYRFYAIDTVPIGSFRDEGKAAKDSMDIMRGLTPLGADSSLPVYIRAITDNPAVYNYFMTGLFPFVGEGIVGARIATAFAGFLTAVSFYFILRYMFGWRTAFLAGLFFAFGRYPVTFSRLVYHASFAMLPYMFVLYFVIRSYNERKIWDFLLLGLSMGLSIQTYHAARIIPFAYAALLGLCWFTDKGFIKANYGRIILAFVVTAVVLIPMGLYIMKNYRSFMERPSGLLLLSVSNKHLWFSSNPVSNYLISLKKALLMYNQKGGNSIIYSNYDGVPMLDRITGIFAVTGFMLLVAGLFVGNNYSIFFLALFFIFIQGTALFIESPHTGRGIMAMPMVFVFVAFSISVMFRLFYDNAGKISKVLVVMVIAVLIIISASDNFNQYFNLYGKNSNAWRSFETDKRKAAEYLVGMGKSWQGIMSPYFMFGDMASTPDVTIVMWSHKMDNYEKLTAGYNLPVKPVLGKNYVYILDRDYFAYLPALKMYYPDGELVNFYEKYNEKVLSFVAYKVTYDQALKGLSVKPAHGLVASYYDGNDCGVGQLLDKRIEPLILQNWHYFPKNINRFAVCWQGRIRIDTPGIYTFDVRNGETKRLVIDDKTIIDGPIPYAKIDLKVGMHKIYAMYRNNGNLWFGLWWTLPSATGTEPVPVDNLYPQ